MKSTLQVPAFSIPRLASWKRALVHLLVGGLSVGPAWAQTPIADPRAPLAWRPVVQVSNGVPVVQITAPNVAGVSLNQYQRFDVPGQGVVLGNSLVGGTALLGAQVQANPNLLAAPGGPRTAATIVNEVTGSGAPGVLAGTVEVFGAPASVIVANPNGVTCNGCGVVNTPRLTLSSGRIQLLDAQGQAVADFGQASRLGFEVQGGQIRIIGGGVEGTVGRVDLVGQSLAIEAPLRAHYLGNDLSTIELSAGTGLVSEQANGQLSRSAGGVRAASIGGTATTGTAIDASALGAMTAGQIRIVSTDAGLGVNLRGPLLAYQQDLSVSGAGSVTVGQASAARDIRLDAGGQLSVLGPLQAQRHLQAQAGGALVLAGPIQVGADLKAQADGDLALMGTTAVGGNAQVQAGARLDVLAPLQVGRDLALNAAQVQISAPTRVGGHQTVQASQSIALDAPSTVGGQLSLQAPTLAINAPIDAAATQLSGGQLDLGQAGQTLALGGDFAIDMSGPVHVRGALDVGGHLALHSGADQQLDGAVSAGGQMRLGAAGDLTLAGPASAGAGMQLQAGGTLNAQSLTAGALDLQAGGTAQLQGPVSVGGDARLQASGLTLESPVLAGGTLDLQAGGGGVGAQRLGANTDLIVHSQGAIVLTQAQALRDLRLDSSQAQITAQSLLAGRHLQAQAGTELQLGGPVQAGGQATLVAQGGAVGLGQTLHAGGDAQIRGQGLDLQGVQAQGGLQLDGGSQAIASQGDLVAAHSLGARTDGAITVQGTMAAGQDLQAQAGTGLLVQGAVIGEGSVALASQGGNLQARTIQAGAALQASAAQDLILEGALAAQGDTRLGAARHLVVAGDVQVGGTLQSQAGGEIRHGTSTLVLGQAMRLQAGQSITMAGPVGVAGDLQARSEQAGVSFGQDLDVGGALQLSAAGAMQFMGNTQVAGTATLQGSTGASVLNQGTMRLGQTLDVNVGADFVNQGLIGAPGDIHIQARHITSNTTGAGGIATEANLSAQASGQLRLGPQGSLSAGQDMTLQAQGGAQTQGSIAAGQALTYGGGLWSPSASVAAQAIQVNADLSNGGQMLAEHIRATGATSNSGQMAAGTIELATTTNGGEISGRQVSLGATQNLGGRISGQTVGITGGLFNAALIGASGLLSVAAGSGTLDNSGQMLGGAIEIVAQDSRNSGQIQATDTLSLRGGQLTNSLSEASRCVADADTCAGRPDADGNPARPLTDADRRWSATPGQIFSGGQLDIQVSELDNQGLIQSAAGAHIQASGHITNTRSANDLWTDANAQASLDGKPTQVGTGVISAGQALDLKASELDNTGLIQAGGALDIQTSQWVNNQAPQAGLDGRLSGQSVRIQAQGLGNQGRIQASQGNVTLRIGESGINSFGQQSVIAAPATLDIQTSGVAHNGAGGQWLADERIRVQADGGLLNSGTLYGQQGAPQAIDIQTGANGLINTASGLIVAGEQLRIESASYGNSQGGTVGALGEATLITPGAYNPALDRLIAKGELNLQTAGLNVQAGQSWASDATSVSWSGTLLNHGRVELAGAASGNVENRYSDLVALDGLPDVGAGAYWLDGSASPPAGVTDAHVVAYTDVGQRAHFSAGSLQGSLLNEASDAAVGGGSSFSYTAQDVAQTATWQGLDAQGNTVTWSGPAQSLARLVASGPVSIHLSTPHSGTIVADSLTLQGGDLVLDSGLDPATGRPLVEAARQRQAPASTPNTSGQVPTQGAANAQAGQAGVQGAGSQLPGASAGATSAGANAGANAPGSGTVTPRNLNLRAPTPQTPEAALAALQSGRDAVGYQPQLTPWDQLRPVPGGITANDLSLQLSGQFTNRSELQVQQDLDLKVAGGIDNQGAAIRAGGRLMIEGASLDNSHGLIQSGGLGHVRTTSGNITATQGQFQSSASAIVLDAAGDLRLAGGSVKGAQGAALIAGGDIDLGVVRSETNTLTLTDRNGTQSRELAPGEEAPRVQYGQQLHREQSISHEGVVINAGAGPLSLEAKGDIHALGAELETEGKALLAGRNVTIEAAKDSQLEQNAEWRKGYDHYDHSYSETLVGGTLSAGQGVSVIANGDAAKGQGNITLKGAVLDGGEGQSLLSATRDISVGTVHTEHSAFEQTLTKGGSVFSKKTTTTRSEGQSSLAQGSAVVGDTVLMVAGRDIEVKGSGLNEMKDAAGNVLVAGSGVMGQNGTTLVAGRDVRIVADEHTASGSSYQQTTKSGLFASGLNLTLGKQSTTTETSQTSTLAAGSSVGSVAGDTSIVAGGHYQQTGSQVLSGGGDVSILAKTASIEEAREIETSQFETRFKQSGLSVGLGGAAIDTATTVVKMGEVAARSDNTRTQVMAGSAAALSAYNNAGKIADTVSALGAGASPTAAGLSLNISLGSSKSQSNASETLDRAKGSQVTAGGNVRIEATQGNVKVQGSEIDAGGTTSLIAKQGAIELLASADTHREHNSSSFSASSIGMSVGVSGDKVGVNANVSASHASSQGDGTSTTYNNTHIKGGQGVHLESAGDTTLKGAVITAPQVTGDIGGNLHIESLQDTAVYDETGKSSGFSLSVPISGAGSVSGSVSGGKTQISSTYQSVGEQSGIRAGDGGFQLEVGGATTLKGGAITSTQVAVDAGKNSLNSAGGISTEDIQNTAAYSAKSQSLSLGFGGGKPTGSAGVGSDSGNASSTTQAGVSGIAGHQDARTGDAETGLQPIFDKNQVKTEVQDQVAASSTFGREASQAWGTYSNNQFEKARQSGDEEGMQCWGPTGGCRAAGHAAWGGLSGGAAGAAAAGGTSMMAPVVYQSLVDTGMPKELAQIVTVASSTVAGNAAGGASAAAAATNEAANNAVVAVPLIVEGVIAAGARAAHACVTSPACMNVVKLAGTAAVAKVVAIASESNEAGAPGYEAAQAPVNHTGNQSAAPNYAGTGTTTPNNGPATGSTTTTPAQQPGAGSGGSNGGFAAGEVPNISPITLAVPPGDRAAIDGALSGTMGGMPNVTRPGGTQISEYPQGTQADAERVFDSLPLSDVRSINSGYGSWGRSGTLPDGTTVTVRPSQDGRPTIEVIDRNRPGDGKRISEIRFGSK